MRNRGFLLNDITDTPLMFTIPALTDIYVLNTTGCRSRVELKHAGIIYTAWINNENIALDTMDILEGGVL